MVDYVKKKLLSMVPGRPGRGPGPGGAPKFSRGGGPAGARAFKVSRGGRGAAPFPTGPVK